MSGVTSSVTPQLLSTKLFAPRPRPGGVLRPHLTARLETALRRAHKLILLSAPAGFGKTSVVSEWHTSTGKRYTFNHKHRSRPASFHTSGCVSCAIETIAQLFWVRGKIVYT